MFLPTLVGSCLSLLWELTSQYLNQEANPRSISSVPFCFKAKNPSVTVFSKIGNGLAHLNKKLLSWMASGIAGSRGLDDPMKPLLACGFSSMSGPLASPCLRNAPHGHRRQRARGGREGSRQRKQPRTGVSKPSSWWGIVDNSIAT